MTESIKWQVVVVAALVATQMGCKADSTTDPGPEGLKIEALSRTSIVGTVGGLSPVDPAIRITGSSSGKPQVGVRVQFSGRWASGPGGELGAYSAITDSAGVASAGYWRFSNRPGLNELLVIIGGEPRLTFTATLKPDVPVRLLAPQDQAEIAGKTIDAFSVRVEDRFDNGVPGLEVKFTVIEGGGTLETEKATTDVDGVARAKGWRLGTTPGTNQTSAVTLGFDPVFFRVEGLDSATIKWYKLVDLRDGSREISLESSGIVDARIGLTPFDKCLCGRQQGYFVRDITFANAGTPSTVRMPGGIYVLNDAELSSPVPYAWSAGSIAGDLLVLDALDPWDEEWTYTWVYRQVNTNGQ